MRCVGHDMNLYERVDEQERQRMLSREADAMSVWDVEVILEWSLWSLRVRGQCNG